MKESFGGTWLFGIVILFIALFTSYLAYSINYTRAFNLKNKILEEIEKSEGYIGKNSEKNIYTMTDQELDEDHSVECTVFKWIRKTGYAFSSAEGIDCDSVDGHEGTQIKSGGYCVTKYCKTVDDRLDEGVFRTYYKVTTFVAFKIPIFGITLKVPITGETRTLYYDNGKTNCESYYRTRSESLGG